MTLPIGEGNLRQACASPSGSSAMKVERRAAAETGAAAEGGLAALAPQDVDQVVLDAERRIVLGGRQVLLEEPRVPLAGRQAQVRALPDHGQAVEVKVVDEAAQRSRQRDHLIDVVARSA